MKPFIDPNLLQRLRVGPLAPYLDAYLKHIEQEGFLPSSAPMQMYAIARFSKWLRDRQCDLHQVDEAAVNRFLKRDPGVVHSCESATLRRLLAMLRQIGVTVAKASEPGTCHQRFIVDYRRYLLRERGLAEATLVYFVRFAEQFLFARFGNGDLNLSELCAKDVTDFVQNRAHQLSPGRAIRYIALEAPQYSGLIQRVIAIPNKRQSRPLVGFLTRPEIDALLAVPDRDTWLGRRNHALLLTVIQTGLRLSEITSIRRQDVSLGKGAHIRCEGKGRKERCTPLAKSTVIVLTAWIKEQGEDDGTRILFPTVRGCRLSADAVQHLVRKYIAVARKTCPSLAEKRVSPHVLRHTTAMELLQSGVDRTLIALWLGHESVETTQIYLDANLAIKEEILAKTTPINVKGGRYRPDDDLLAFLKGL